ncbi:MAG: hypothetical protein AAF357_00290 [Verrucomicrobiota bacterium]
MIYQFKDGPLDGEEMSIPEMPIGEVFRYPMPPAISLTTDFVDFKPSPEARYRVTDIGEMTLESHDG